MWHRAWMRIRKRKGHLFSHKKRKGFPCPLYSGMAAGYLFMWVQRKSTGGNRRLLPISLEECYLLKWEQFTLHNRIWGVHLPLRCTEEFLATLTPKLLGSFSEDLNNITWLFTPGIWENKKAKHLKYMNWCPGYRLTGAFGLNPAPYDPGFTISLSFTSIWI